MVWHAHSDHGPARDQPSQAPLDLWIWHSVFGHVEVADATVVGQPVAKGAVLGTVAESHGAAPSQPSPDFGVGRSRVQGLELERAGHVPR